MGILRDAWSDVKTGVKDAWGHMKQGMTNALDKISSAFSSNSNYDSISSGNVAMPVGDTYRGPLASIFNQENIAREDWQRQVQANAIASDFAASEAEKDRKWQEYMSNTSYQRAVADMRKAGINPIMALSNGGADIGSGAVATFHDSGVSKHNQTDIVADLIKLLAGMYAVGSKNATALQIAKIKK